jgi:hypothetical protein
VTEECLDVSSHTRRTLPSDPNDTVLIGVLAHPRKRDRSEALIRDEIRDDYECIGKFHINSRTPRIELA